MKLILSALAALALVGAAGPAVAAPAYGVAAAPSTAVPGFAAGELPLVHAGYRSVRYHHRGRGWRQHGYGYGYGYGYGSRPYIDWTSRCMEDLGYGRRGMWGCGGR